MPARETSPASPVPWLVAFSIVAGTPEISEVSNSIRYGSPSDQLMFFSDAGRTMLYAPPDVIYHEGAAGYRHAVDQSPPWFTYTAKTVLFANGVVERRVPAG